jgi:cellulase
MVGLHNSQAPGGTEIFMGCAQLKVTGSSSGTCGPTIAIPGAYDATDKSLLIPDYYNGFDKTSYKAPGGPIASCGGIGEGAAPTAPSTPQPASSTVAAAPSPIASPSAVVEAPPKSAPVEPVGSGEAPVSSPVVPSDPASVPAPAASSDGSADVLPASFSLDTFVSWFKGKLSELEDKLSGSKARRHARAF